MAQGQLWGTNSIGGFLYSDELSDKLRFQVNAAVKFRQFCDARDATDKGLHAGELFHWNVFSDLSTIGSSLVETTTMPETGFTITQGTLTLTERGNSVPYTGKLDNFSRQPVLEIVEKALARDARKSFDIAAWEQFNAAPLRVVPTGGTSTTAVTLTTNGTATLTNNVALGKDHVKAIVDTMKERNIPSFMYDDYFCVAHPTTLRTFKNNLEAVFQYHTAGYGPILNGELGRFESTRFFEQNQIPKGGAADSTTFNAYTGTADAWNNAASSWAFFFGADTCMEAVAIPEEIRGKIPSDFGRSRGVAWYYLGGFGIVHGSTSDATNARIVKWDSAA